MKLRKLIALLLVLGLMGILNVQTMAKHASAAVPAFQLADDDPQPEPEPEPDPGSGGGEAG